MDIEVEFGTEDGADEVANAPRQDPDEFLAQNSFRIVYQTNNFFLPQISDMIKKGEIDPEFKTELSNKACEFFRRTTPMFEDAVEIIDEQLILIFDWYSHC